MKIKILYTVRYLVLCTLVLLPPEVRGIAGGTGKGQSGESGAGERLRDQILFDILDLQFGKADSLIRLAGREHPEDPGLLYLDNYLDFLDALISGEREDYERYLPASGSRIERLREFPAGDPGTFLCLSSIHLQSFFLCAYHGELFRAGKHFLKAYRFLRQGEEKDTGNPLKFRNRGLILLVNASVPEEFSWLLKVLGLRGGFAEGLGYLEEYRTAVRGAGWVEACLLLSLAGQTLDPTGQFFSLNPDCGKRARTLTLYAGVLHQLGSGNSRAVVDSLMDYRQEEGERSFPYLDLLLGEARLNGLDTAAWFNLQEFTREYGGLHYRHYAWHKLSWAHAICGEWGLYRQDRQQVLGAGEPFLDADRQALAEAADTLPLNIGLLEARLLFDGGYYQEARSLLESGDPIALVNRRDSIEYRYRLARINDRLGNTGKAVAGYETVIREAAGEDWYFIPSSALHLGEIREAGGNLSEALELYRLCLKVNQSGYKQSIGYKARQGIRRIEKRQKLR